MHPNNPNPNNPNLNNPNLNNPNLNNPNLNNMNPNKMLWEKGDFTQIAALMRQSGESFVKSLGVTVPLRVLDLGCGDGTTALPLAQMGADVLGINIACNLVDAGNRRAAENTLDRLRFQEGDAW